MKLTEYLEIILMKFITCHWKLGLELVNDIGDKFNLKTARGSFGAKKIAENINDKND